MLCVEWAFLQTGSADPVTELSLFSSGWVVLFWFFVCVCVGCFFFFKYHCAKWILCCNSCILCCSFKLFSWIFNMKFGAYYRCAKLLLSREQATIALVSVPLTLHLLSGGWNTLAHFHFHFCLCCSWLVATLRFDQSN